ncbi:BglG family transcription antiterminator [Staphylospora marina]|uniref:BglG family transcription antiterminator n=1 Tax=Staphylospora marina TaxID=2490858 RepID=UPI000F5BDB09|nr:PRD domain-containing protein [Staphylospora marina]
MIISSRQRQILEILLRKREVTVRDIAAETHVSPRTIHRELTWLEKRLEPFGLKLEKKAGSGLFLHGTSEQRTRLKQTLAKLKPVEYTAEERKIRILCTLLEATEPIKTLALAHELKVTPATVSHDLDALTDWLRSWGLSLIRRRGYGVEIAGPESSKRKAIRSLISEHLDESHWIPILKNTRPDVPDPLPDAASERLLRMIPRETLIKVDEELRAADGIFPTPLADSARIGMVIHLALAMERIAKGETVEMDPEDLEKLAGTPEYRLAREMARRLEGRFGHPVPPEEIGHVAMHLKGAKLGHSRYEPMEDSRAELTATAGKLITLCEKKLDADLSDDRSLLEGLVVHLEPAIHRMKRNMKIRNPLLPRIQKDYPNLFRVVREAARSVFPHLDVPDEEIGYLVMHFGSALERVAKKNRRLRILIVCSGGLGSSKLLASRIQSSVPEAEVLRNVSVFEIDDMDPGEYDLIVSTVPIPSRKPDEVLLMNPLPTDEDLEKIRRIAKERSFKIPCRIDKSPRIVRELDELQRVHSLLGHALDLMDRFFVTESSVRSGNLEEILRQACLLLEQKNILDSGKPVVTRLLEREKLGGLGIPDARLGLFHCRSDHVLHPSFSVHRLNDRVSVRSMDDGRVDIDKIVLMVCPASGPREVVELLSHISSLLIEPDTVHVLESEDESGIRKHFANRLYQFCTSDIHTGEERSS